MVENILTDAFTCKLCNKHYKDKSGLWYHNKKYHNESLQNSLKITSNLLISPQNSLNLTHFNSNDKIECKFCNKELSRKDNLKRHEKKCPEKERQEKQKEIYEKKLDLMNSEIEKLKKGKYTRKTINYINNSLNSNNNTLNSGNTNTLNICGVGQEDVKLLNFAESESIKSQGMNSIIGIIDKLNFNSRLPQNHNFYTSSLNDKYVNTLDLQTNSIIKKSKKDLFDLILCSHTKKLESISNNDKDVTLIIDKLKKFLLLKRGKTEFISQLNMLSYNKRDLVINTWMKLTDNDNINPDEAIIKLQEEVKQLAESDKNEINSDNDSISDDDSDTDSDSDSDDSIRILIPTPSKKKHLIV